MSPKSVVTLLLMLFLFPANSHALDKNLGDCAQATVASAVAAASDGDRIICPAGSWTWSSTVTLNKQITLLGAGPDSTIITSGTAIQISGTKSFNISGFRFLKGSYTQTFGYINIGSSGTGWRIHNNKFYNAYGRSINVQTSAYGLIDKNTFVVENNGGGWQQGITVIGERFDARKENYMAYLGTINAIYIENNTFDWMDRQDGAVDTGGAVRVVFRYNLVNGTHFNTHGTSTGYRVGPAYLEVYGNTFTGKLVGSTGNAPMRVFNIRGGTGVFYNNTASGTFTFGANGMFGNDRTPGTGGASSWGGDCDGTKWKVNNPTGSATLSLTGTHMFCSTTRDQYCTVNSDCPSAETCSTYFDGNDPGGYLCRAQVGTGPNQTLEPFYVWNNKITDQGNSEMPISSASYHIAAGRDYKLMARPAYIALAYPHPLTLTTVPSSNPAAPSILSIE